MSWMQKVRVAKCLSAPRWHNVLLPNCRGGKMSGWQNVGVAKCRGCKMSRWQNVWLQNVEKSLGLRPRDFPWAQAIFHRLPLLSSQYSYSIAYEGQVERSVV